MSQAEIKAVLPVEVRGGDQRSQPALTAVEIAQRTGQNVGTVRIFMTRMAQDPALGIIVDVSGGASRFKYSRRAIPMYHGGQIVGAERV